MKRTNLSSFFAACSLVVFALHCGSARETPTTAAGDRDVIQRIEGTWVATGSDGRPITLTLCEDRSANAGESSPTCGTKHVVRSDATSSDAVDLEPGGCGGCAWDISAFVDGAIVDADGVSAPVAGALTLTTVNTDDPYARPYALSVRTPYDGAAGYGSYAPSKRASLTAELSLENELTSGSVSLTGFDGAEPDTDAGAAAAVPASDAGTSATPDADAGADASTDTDAGAAAPAPSSSGSAGSTGTRYESRLTFRRVGPASCGR